MTAIRFFIFCLLDRYFHRSDSAGYGLRTSCQGRQRLFSIEAFWVMDELVEFSGHLKAVETLIRFRGQTWAVDFFVHTKSIGEITKKKTFLYRFLCVILLHFVQFSPQTRLTWQAYTIKSASQNKKENIKNIRWAFTTVIKDLNLQYRHCEITKIRKN